MQRGASVATAPVEVATGGSVESPGVPYARLKPGPGRPASEVAEHQRARIHAAMVEIAGERGYEAVTARELSRLSGVSTRAFYSHFDGKEECFLHTHEAIVRRAARRIVLAQAGERDWRERLRLAFEAYAGELAREPAAARLVLIEAYSAGPAALEQIRRAQRSFEAMVAESFGRAPDRAAVPQLVIEGVVAGAERVARARLAAEREGELARLGSALAGWALACGSEAAASLADLDSCFVPESPSVGLHPVPSSGAKGGETGARSSTDDRALLLSAVARLAASEGYAGLTVSRVHAVAGVSRRCFDAHFDGVEDCFLAALEQQAGAAIARAAAEGDEAGSWEAGVQRAIASLCRQIASDPVLAGLCFVEAFGPGAGGMRCRERLMADLVERLRDASPPARQVEELAVEASVGAVWGVIHRHVVSGTAQQLPRIAPTLSYLALAPVAGPEAAIATIREGLAVTG